MTDDQWNAVREYITDCLKEGDAVTIGDVKWREVFGFERAHIDDIKARIAADGCPFQIDSAFVSKISNDISDAVRFLRIA